MTSSAGIGGRVLRTGARRGARPADHPEQARRARTALGGLYRAAFRAQGASSTVTGTHTRGLSYLMLDTHPASEETPARAIAVEPEQTEPPVSIQPLEEYTGTPRIVRRSARRPARRDPTSSADVDRARTPVDEWTESASLRLLIGAPGSGKSSFLMFAAADILAAEPQSAALQRAHGGDLPLWLPFGFLCRHLDGFTTNSVVSATQAWVTSRADPRHGISRSQPSMTNGRSCSLTASMSGATPHPRSTRSGSSSRSGPQRRIGAILTTRPYGVDRLNWVGPWAKAVLAPSPTPIRSIWSPGCCPSPTR